MADDRVSERLEVVRACQLADLSGVVRWATTQFFVLASTWWSTPVTSWVVYTIPILSLLPSLARRTQTSSSFLYFSGANRLCASITTWMSGGSSPLVNRSVCRWMRGSPRSLGEPVDDKIRSQVQVDDDDPAADQFRIMSCRKSRSDTGV